MSDETNIEDILKSQELSSVEFVRDYIQLHFDGPALSILRDATLRRGGEEMAPTDKNYKNVICGCIGHRLVVARVVGELAIELMFENGVGLSIPITGSDNRESASLFSGGKFVAVW